jgi:deaminated glutathione amidase
MRVAACQMRSGDDVEANVATAEALLREAADGGADIAVLPEVFPYLGPVARISEIAQPLDGSIAARLAAVARERGMWIVGGSIHEADEGRVHNTAPLFDRSGGLVARYRKIHLFDVDLPDQPRFRESAIYAAGDQLVTHPTDLARVGFAICYDLRFPELFRGLVSLGAEVIVLPAQFQFLTGEAHWHVLLRARAIEDQCFLVAAAQWGGYGDPDAGRRSYGHSLVVDPWGRVLAEAAEEGTGVVFADLDLSELRRVRTVLPALEHRRLGISC